MPTKQRRYSLKTKEAKQILTEASANLKFDLETLFGSKANVEVVEFEAGMIYLIGEKPLLFKAGEKVLPTLLFTEFVAQAPKIVVDMGAVPFVCKGATVMAPGDSAYRRRVHQGRHRCCRGHKAWESFGVG